MTTAAEEHGKPHSPLGPSKSGRSKPQLPQPRTTPLRRARLHRQAVVEAYGTGAGLPATSALMAAPPRVPVPPLPMQRTATPSPTRRRSAPAPGLKTTTAFRPSPPANALRLRRPVAVLRRRQSAAQLYAVVDLYTAIWFVTRMRRLTGADSAQHDLLTISRTWISASVSSEQWGHVSQWRRRRAAASRGI